MILWVKSVPGHHWSSHMPSQQNWSGVLVRKRSCSCSLQRGEFEFLVLKSTVLHSCSHHTLLCKCQAMALQRKQAPSVSTACALHAMLHSGRTERCLQEAATLAAASAGPVLAHTVRSSSWGGAAKLCSLHQGPLRGETWARKRAGAHWLPFAATECRGLNWFPASSHILGSSVLPLGASGKSTSCSQIFGN